MTPGSIVTDFGKSQLVDPGWSKFDFDQNMWFFLFLQAKQGLSPPPHAIDTWNLFIYLIILLENI